MSKVNKKSLREEARGVVDELNDVIGDIDGEWMFTYTECSYSCGIDCGMIRLWDSENDDRVFDEVKNDYEPLLPFVIKKLDEVAETLSKLLKGNEQ